MVGFYILIVRSTKDTSIVGTLIAIPVNLPLRDGMINPTALAAPVDDGIKLLIIDLPALQSLPPLHGPSTVN